VASELPLTLPVWSEHSLRQAQGRLCPLPLTLILILIWIFTSHPKKRRGCPILARSVRKGGTLRRPQRVPLTFTLLLPLPVWSGRPCPLPLTLILTLISHPKKRRGCPILSRSMRKGGTLRRPQHVPLTLMLVLPLTLIVGSGQDWEGHDAQSFHKTETAVEEQRFSAPQSQGVEQAFRPALKARACPQSVEGMGNYKRARSYPR
jgi:hypothetical protein